MTEKNETVVLEGLPDEEEAGYLPPIADHSGSPSKQRRPRSIFSSAGSAPRVVDGEIKERRKWRCIWCVAICFFCVTLGGIAVAVLIAMKQISFPSGEATTKVIGYDYQACVGGWDPLEPFLSLEENETPCKSLADELCPKTVGCCWQDSSCVPFKHEAECASLSEPATCELNEYCAWRSSIKACRRVNKPLENALLERLDACSASWNTSSPTFSFRCSSLENEDRCHMHRGCCWDFDLQSCTPGAGVDECIDRIIQDDCEYSYPNNRPVCSWKAETTSCIPLGALVSGAPAQSPRPTAFIATRYPTRARSPSRKTSPTVLVSSLVPSSSNTAAPSNAKTIVPTMLATKGPTHLFTAEPTKFTPSPSFKVTSKPSVRDPPADVPSPRPTRVINRKTSFLIMMMDDAGWGDVSYIASGTLQGTPNIDAMARGANTIQMMRFHSAGISCSPTRASLLSARGNIRDCVWGPNTYWDRKNFWFKPEFPFQGAFDKTLGSLAQQNGWRTGFFGKFHLDSLTALGGPWGFDRWVATGGNSPTFDTTCYCLPNPKACAKSHYPDPSDLGPFYDCNVYESSSIKLKQSVRNKTSAEHFESQLEDFLNDLQENESFFAVLAFHEPHVPFISAPWLKNSDLAVFPKNLPNRDLQMDYYGAIRAVDEAVGKARASLKRLERDGDTLVLFASDNGPELTSLGGAGSTGGLRGRKRSLFEGGHRVPGLLEWPQGIRGNVVTNSLISMMDVSATIMELILQDNVSSYLSLVDSIDGESLLDPILTSSVESFKRAKPIFLCSTATSDVRRGCTSLAVMLPPSWKLIVNVRADGSIDRSTAKLYDYDSGETSSLSTTLPQFSMLLQAASDYARDIVAPSYKKCRFPVLN